MTGTFDAEDDLPRVPVPTLADSATAPAAIISVFCAATTMRASKGRPSASAPSSISQPFSRSNGARFLARRFCLTADSPSSAGPIRSKTIGVALKTHASRPSRTHGTTTSRPTVRWSARIWRRTRPAVRRVRRGFMPHPRSRLGR